MIVSLQMNRIKEIRYLVKIYVEKLLCDPKDKKYRTIAPRKDENVHLDILKGLKINKCIKYSLFRMYP